jgi:hypothetical protein
MDADPSRQVRVRFCHEDATPAADGDDCYRGTDQPLPHGALRDRQRLPSRR